MKTTDRHFTKGFTLIELILVTMILEIIATATVRKFIDIKSEADIKALDNTGVGLTAYPACF